MGKLRFGREYDVPWTWISGVKARTVLRGARLESQYEGPFVKIGFGDLVFLQKVCFSSLVHSHRRCSSIRIYKVRGALVRGSPQL